MITIDTRAEGKRIDRAIQHIQKYKAYLTKQQYRTLLGQCKKGDTEQARKGLQKLLNRVARESQPTTRVWRAE